MSCCRQSLGECRGACAIEHRDTAAADPRREPENRLVARVFTPVALGYWRGPTAVQAWGLTLGFGTAIMVTIGAGVVFSYWNRWFFDGLEQRNADVVLWSIATLLAIALVATAAEVVLVLTREAVQVRWRAWLSREIIDRWLGRQRFYHLNSSGGDDATVPEYRISDDVRWATEPIMDFYHGILGSTVAVISFVGILWVVGGPIRLGTEETGVTVPGYMVVAGVLHAALLLALMWWCARTLPANMRARNEAEAHFRLGLMRVRENADSVALTHGESGERAILWRALESWVNRWMVVVRQDGQMTWILRGNGFILPVIPLLLAAPKYLSGDYSLGTVMQLASAYVSFQTSIAWAVDNFRALSNWHASAYRVAALIQSMRELDDDLDDPEKSAIVFAEGEDGFIRIERLTVTSRDGAVLVNRADLVVAPGEKLLLTGESGTGKSALVRTLGGLWPWGSGLVRLPRGARLSFVPHRAYLPLGSLREVLRYPLDRLDADDGTIVDAMVRCGIGHLAPRLDAVERWDQSLSTGERQRLAFTRLLLQRPTVAILDDALAALGETGQAAIMDLLRDDLTETTVISVAQHGGLERFHDRTVTLIKADGGARLQSNAPHRLVALRPGE